jgi:hypothetical protein
MSNGAPAASALSSVVLKNVPHPPLQTIDFIAHGTVLAPTAAGASVLKVLEKLAPP